MSLPRPVIIRRFDLAFQFPVLRGQVDLYKVITYFMYYQMP